MAYTIYSKRCRAFLGFANFYRRWIRDYCFVAHPLTTLLRKDVTFHWNTDCQRTFNKLKQCFTTAPILRHFDFDHAILVENDIFYYVSACVLSLYGDNNILHPNALFSKEHTFAECNYKIFNKELFGILRAFKEWHPYLKKFYPADYHPVQLQKSVLHVDKAPQSLPMPLV